MLSFLDVNIKIGKLYSLRISSSVSNPSMPGIITSSTTSWYSCSLNFCKPSFPVLQKSASMFSACTLRLIRAHSSLSSSIIRILFMMQLLPLFCCSVIEQSLSMNCPKENQNCMADSANSSGFPVFPYLTSSRRSFRIRLPSRSVTIRRPLSPLQTILPSM